MCWCTAIIPDTWKVEIGRISVWGQSRQKVTDTPISRNNLGPCGGA
jgi:hypothetical protein